MNIITVYSGSRRQFVGLRVRRGQPAGWLGGPRQEMGRANQGRGRRIAPIRLCRIFWRNDLAEATFFSASTYDRYWSCFRSFLSEVWRFSYAIMECGLPYRCVVAFSRLAMKSVLRTYIVFMHRGSLFSAYSDTRDTKRSPTIFSDILSRSNTIDIRGLASKCFYQLSLWRRCPSRRGDLSMHVHKR